MRDASSYRAWRRNAARRQPVWFRTAVDDGEEPLRPVSLPFRPDRPEAQHQYDRKTWRSMVRARPLWERIGTVDVR